MRRDSVSRDVFRIVLAKLEYINVQEPHIGLQSLAIHLITGLCIYYYCPVAKVLETACQRKSAVLRPESAIL